MSAEYSYMCVKGGDLAHAQPNAWMARLQWSHITQNWLVGP